MPSAKTRVETYESGAYLRQRLVLSTLSGTAIRVKNIRSDDAEKPGLSASEVSFLRLLDKLSAGASIAINDTGTALTYKPGLLLGAASSTSGPGSLSHECHASRGLSYYIEPLVLLAPFCARPLDIALHGATAAPADPDADSLAAALPPLVARLSQGAVALGLEVRRRALDASGLVVLRCGVAHNRLPPADLGAPAGRVWRVRGLAFGAGVSPALVARMVDRARGVLNRFCADVWIRTDVNSIAGAGGARKKKKKGANSSDKGHQDGGGEGDNDGDAKGNGEDVGRRGIGLSLVAELRDAGKSSSAKQRRKDSDADAGGGCVAADWCTADASVPPERVADAAVGCLLEEVEGGGAVDSARAPLAIAWCAAAAREVSRVRVGRLSAAAVETLRDAERLLGVRFRVRVRGGAVGEDDETDEEGEEEEEGDEAGGGDGEDVKDATGIRSSDGGYGTVLSCVGAGVVNVARRRF